MGGGICFASSSASGVVSLVERFSFRGLVLVERFSFMGEGICFASSSASGVVSLVERFSFRREIWF
jgi:hypothetical protein